VVGCATGKRRSPPRRDGAITPGPAQSSGRACSAGCRGRPHGRSLSELSRASGVHLSRISRFIRGERSIDLSAASALCGVLGYKLVKGKPATKNQVTSRTSTKVAGE